LLGKIIEIPKSPLRQSLLDMAAVQVVQSRLADMKQWPGNSPASCTTERKTTLEVTCGNCYVH